MPLIFLLPSCYAAPLLRHDDATCHALFLFFFFAAADAIRRRCFRFLID